MEKVTIHIKAKEGSFTFTFKYSNDKKIKEILNIFGEQPKEKPYYVMTSEIKDRATKYAQLHLSKLSFFYKFKIFIESIGLGDRFLILNEKPKNFNEQFYYNFLIESLNEPSDEKNIEGLIQTKYEKLPKNIKTIIENYNSEVFSQDKISRVGEPNKNKRVCRFCFRSIATGATFKNKAHAISEGLGNKSIFINEECDSCNEKFGNSIEHELLLYFDLFRTFAGLKGKRGYRKIEFDECSLFYDGKLLNMKVKEGYEDIFTEVTEKNG